MGVEEIPNLIKPKFMDAISMLLLTLPVVYSAVMALGFDSIWFGIIVVKMADVITIIGLLVFSEIVTWLPCVMEN